MKMDITTRETLVLQRRVGPTWGDCPRCGGWLYLNPEGGPDGLREVGCTECTLVAEFRLDSAGGWFTSPAEIY